MFVFQKIWRALFSRNTRFEVHPFALLPTKRPTERDNHISYKISKEQKNASEILYFYLLQTSSHNSFVLNLWFLSKFRKGLFGDAQGYVSAKSPKTKI